MGKQDTGDLLQFLKPFDTDTINLVLWLRDFVWNNYPAANELIYDNYNAVAVGWSLSEKLGDTFCSTAVFRTNSNVHFGFLKGNLLPDPEKILIGKGKQYRYLPVKEMRKFPVAYMKKLLKISHALAQEKAKFSGTVPKGITITKSVSEAKRKK